MITIAHSQRSTARPSATFVGCLVALMLSSMSCERPTTDVKSVAAGTEARPRVTGVGGVFLSSNDPATMREWYQTHLGIEVEDWGGFAFQWLEKSNPGETGYTVWGTFPDSTDYFSPSAQPFMVNYRVSGLPGLIEMLREAGVTIVGEVEEHPNGLFAWILDPEGRKIELWEPVASKQDPYLMQEPDTP